MQSAERTAVTADHKGTKDTKTENDIALVKATSGNGGSYNREPQASNPER